MGPGPAAAHLALGQGELREPHLTDQTSILRFIQDNWLGGQRISAISFDTVSGSPDDLFDFTRPKMRRLRLDHATGLPH